MLEEGIGVLVGGGEAYGMLRGSRCFMPVRARFKLVCMHSILHLKRRNRVGGFLKCSFMFNSTLTRFQKVKEVGKCVNILIALFTVVKSRSFCQAHAISYFNDMILEEPKLLKRNYSSNFI